MRTEPDGPLPEGWATLDGPFTTEEEAERRMRVLVRRYRHPATTLVLVYVTRRRYQESGWFVIRNVSC